MKPELRQFGSLTAADFQRIPVWLACHVADYDEPWYSETDEETFRPWTGELPVSAGEGMLLVSATATLADGASLPGFLTPSPDNELGTIQPQVFVRERLFSFWGGMPGVPRETRGEFYAAVGKGPDTVFPIAFSVAAGLVREATTITLEGFYRSLNLKESVVER